MGRTAPWGFSPLPEQSRDCRKKELMGWNERDSEWEWREEAEGCVFGRPK